MLFGIFDGPPAGIAGPFHLEGDSAQAHLVGMVGSSSHGRARGVTLAPVTVAVVGLAESRGPVVAGSQTSWPRRVLRRVSAARTA